jgi:microcystin-dependent protein
MSYQVNYTETNNPAKAPLTVADQTLNNQTSLTFVGKNYAGYAPLVAGNFLHLLENFAAPTAPTSPVQGQIWYDNSAGVNLLKVYDGTNWNAAGAVKKSDTTPNGLIGDLWIDTNNKQLYIYSGSNWLLVGPQFSAGLKTGPQVETIVDAQNPPVSHNVISMYSNDTRVAIISADSFTPKTALTGFNAISAGINIQNSTLANFALSTYKFIGTASSADALNTGGKSVAASSFLRSDQTSVTNFPLQINNSGGLSLGTGLNFNITSDGSQTVMYSKTAGSSINLQVNNNTDGLVTLVHLNAQKYVGIGLNNTNPQATLDVLGTLNVSGIISNTNNTDAREVGTGALITDGGFSVAKKSYYGDDITSYGQIFLNYLDGGTSGNPQSAALILPGTDSAAHLYDIGTSTRPFRNVYADSFVGAFNGAFSGTLTGNITGTASALASATAFSLTGDVSSNTISYNGQTQTGTATFTVTLAPNAIIGRDKTPATDSQNSDQFLIYRNDVTNPGLRTISKSTFFSNVATVPIGAIFPFAGGQAPRGYLLCDGAEVLIGSYPLLYQVIGYTYKLATSLLGQNTFGLPDLRGRFPLGADNMNNNIQVPAKSVVGQDPTSINTIGTFANRVTEVTADVVGSSSGSSTKIITTEQLPDHEHTLNSGQGQYYAAGLPGGVDGSGKVKANRGMPTSSTGYGFPSSGGVNSAKTSQPFNIMNPYQTINYIIFTGAL